MINSFLFLGEVFGLYFSEELEFLFLFFRDMVLEVGFRGIFINFFVFSKFVL